jgi:DHA2 family methylenomycin A resistance protein-like MFS transporter
MRMTVTSARAQTGFSGSPPPGRTLFVASLGFFLITLDILIVTVALTRIGRDLGGGTVGQQWTVDGYTLMFASLLLLAGNLSDRLGAKLAFTIGIALFLLASVVCALAPTLGALVAARFVQGSGAAIMLPASMSLIREAYPDHRKRAHALGVWAVGGAVAGAVGPLLGGLLTTIDWRLVFAINLPVCVAMLILLAPTPHSPRRPSPFDWAGQITAVLALATLTYGLIEGGANGFGTPPAMTSLGIAAASTAAFLLIQARGSHPMMPLELFRPLGMRISLGVGFSFMVANFGSVFVASLYLQQRLGLSPLLAGVVFLPSAAFSVTGNIISGTLANGYGSRVPVMSGLTCMAAGLIGLLLTAPTGNPLWVGIFLILTGFGGAVSMPQVASVVLASVPAANAGTASAVFNTFRQVGGAVAIAVFGALLADPSTFVLGLQTSFVIAAALLILSAIASIFLPRTPTTY